MARSPAAAPSTVGPGDVDRAERAIAGLVRRTPMLHAGELSRRVGARVLLKAENLQLTGSFKVRGASNRIGRLSAVERERGVVAASAGNHAQGVAFAARRLGVRATVCMPAGAPLAKVAAVRQYGGTVRLVPGLYDDAKAAAVTLAGDEGKVLIPAFDDADVVAGQGTVGLEIAREAPDVRLVVVPLGGGGLASGAAIALKAALPGVRVIGVQAERCAAYPTSIAAHRPLAIQSPGTICDDIAVKRPGDLTLPLVEHYLDDVVTVSDDEVAAAMVLLLERSKQVVEGAGAAGVAALLHGVIEPPATGEVCAVLSGGNVDATLLAECIRLAETASGRRMSLAAVVPDRPGALAALLAVVADGGGNVLEVEHLRDGVALHVRETIVRVVLQTSGPAHYEELLQAVRNAGFDVRPER